VRNFVQAVQHDSTASPADSASHARAGELKLLRPPARGLVDLNEATFAELEQLPGVGAVMAERILAYRQRKGRFTKVEELAEVKGIGRKRLETLKGLVKVE
jgi:competence protein ComEA